MGTGMAVGHRDTLVPRCWVVGPFGCPMSPLSLQYYDDTYPSVKEQKAFEKNIFNKTHRTDSECPGDGGWGGAVHCPLPPWGRHSHPWWPRR